MTNFHSIKCPKCTYVITFRETYSFFAIKSKCPTCENEFKIGKEGIEEQVIIKLIADKGVFLRSVLFYSNATKLGLMKAKEEVEKIALENNIEIQKDSKCFIATAAYGSPLAQEVIILKNFRDNVLLKSFAGKLFVYTYYIISPPIASMVKKSDFLKTITLKYVLSPVLKYISSIKSR